MGERVAFDATLYREDALQAAVEAYSEVAKIEVSQGEGSFDAELMDVGDYDPKMIVHAFANHVLHETIARRRQAVLDTDS